MQSITSNEVLTGGLCMSGKLRNGGSLIHLASRTSIDVHVGQKIMEGRKLNQLSTSDLADRLGIDHQDIQYIEQGRCRASAETLMKLASLFDVPIGYFYPKF